MPQFADPGSGDGVVHGAVLERAVVPVDRGLGGGDLGGEGGEFCCAVTGRGVVVGLGTVDHVGEDRVGVGVEVVEGVQDEFVDFVGA
ncbi:hypothetical protein [Actinoplanes subtropicus]|uniref:hypothetical protein n=1 Tax=Actinoplanes subtropicus TaxID=543632 RepID=UPI0004C34026|nr:hypothetical protein [Actinoplanes subtropicus]